MEQHKICCTVSAIVLQIIMMLVGIVVSTVDIDMSEMKYLANHLQPEECRRLVAALHYKTYNKPNSLDVAADKVSEDIPCLRLLLHWNSATGEGKGETHEMLFRRLRQIGRDDLAEWLGRTVFHELGQDLEKSLDNPFNDDDNINNLEADKTEFDEDIRDIPNSWTTFDTVSWTIILFLCILTTAIVVKLIYNSCRNRKTNPQPKKFGKYKELENLGYISDSESEDKFDIRKKNDPALKLMGV